MLHTRLYFGFSLPFLLSAIGAQVALVLLSLLLSLLSFRVEAIWRGIFPIHLFERVFNFLAWNQKTLQRPVVSVKLRGCVCYLSSHLPLCTLLGVMREDGPKSVYVLDHVIYWQLNKKLNCLLFSFGFVSSGTGIVSIKLD